VQKSMTSYRGEPTEGMRDPAVHACRTSVNYPF
jgi:hypothetical protein